MKVCGIVQALQISKKFANSGLPETLTSGNDGKCVSTDIIGQVRIDNGEALFAGTLVLNPNTFIDDSLTES